MFRGIFEKQVKLEFVTTTFFENILEAIFYFCGGKNIKLTSAKSDKFSLRIFYTTGDIFTKIATKMNIKYLYIKISRKKFRSL
jgi:hypothetical protein